MQNPIQEVYHSGALVGTSLYLAAVGHNTNTCTFTQVQSFLVKLGKVLGYEIYDTYIIRPLQL